MFEIFIKNEFNLRIFFTKPLRYNLIKSKNYILNLTFNY